MYIWGDGRESVILRGTETRYKIPLQSLEHFSELYNATSFKCILHAFKPLTDNCLDHFRESDLRFSRR